MLKPPPKQLRGHETKLHILNVAAELHLACQPGLVTMSQIAQVAAVSHGTAYRYFTNLPEMWQFAADTLKPKTQELSGQIFGVEIRDPQDLADKWARLYLSLSNLRRENQGLLMMARMFVFGVNPIVYTSWISTQIEYWRLHLRHVFVQTGATKDEQELLLSWMSEQFLSHVFLAPSLSDTADARIETLRCSGKIRSHFSWINIT